MALPPIRHGAFAAVLLPFSLLLIATAAYVYNNKTIDDDKAPIFLALAIAGPACWLWGFFHLTLNQKLSPLWSLLGLLFIVGLALLFWAAGNQPRWEHQRIRRYASKLPAPTPAEDSDDGSPPSSGKKANVPPPRE